MAFDFGNVNAIKKEKEKEKSYEIKIDADKYTTKIAIPEYKVTRECPKFEDMYDTTVTDKLIESINKSDVPAKVKNFLTLAAHRFTEFNYGNVAEFYAHADDRIKDLMERSALVIVEPTKATKYGFVKCTDLLNDVFGED